MCTICSDYLCPPTLSGPTRPVFLPAGPFPVFVCCFVTSLSLTRASVLVDLELSVGAWKNGGFVVSLMTQ